MTWELYAFRYGEQPNLSTSQTVTHIKRLPKSSPPQPFCYFFWLARTKKTTILIDCGFTSKQAAARGRTLLVNPEDLLGEIDIHPDEVDDLILTHLHYDHAGNIDTFPKARIHVHIDEWMWATSPEMTVNKHARFYDPDIISKLIYRLYAGKLQFINDDHTFISGLWVKRLGGHCPGQMVVKIPTGDSYTVLASDAAHLSVNIEQQNPFPIMHDMSQMEKGLAYLSSLARTGIRIVPGHDPNIYKIGTPVGISGNVIALHEI
ncbi:hypothetical protein AB835_06935 [Candidatus Endobugula sertula]|uniref:Metallo-beta-lactamase domain-containing protein n=1 Tax=Candidatus Endobugula sertula TaxID=62101 RepID=A0A1D2QQH3_9GAMM|nr:hypothetical protein AB835_06935 [Candidatus Endobugula sertula]